jgi:hypothetical protein
MSSTSAVKSMAYHADIANRAARNPRGIFRGIDGADSPLARRWFNGLEEAIHGVDTSHQVVTVIHIRHGAQDAMPDADK